MAQRTAKVIQYKIRVREDLRRRIEQEAKKRGVSANYEMVSRLERSFSEEAVQSLGAVAQYIHNAWLRLDEAFYGLSKQGDLIRAAEALVKQVEQPTSNTAIEKAAEKVKQAIRLIEQDAATLPRRMHTTGADK